MTYYYSILRKTINSLEDNSAEIRQVVYRKVRSLIDSQLRELTPASSEDAIGEQLRLLEEAILVVEAEFTKADKPKLEIPLETVAPVHNQRSLQSFDQSEVGKSSQYQRDASFDAVPRRDYPGFADDEDAAFKFAERESQPKSSGWVKTLSVLVLLFAVIGGAGYVAWANKASLIPVLSSFFLENEVIGTKAENAETKDNQEQNAVEANAEIASRLEEVAEWVGIWRLGGCLLGHRPLERGEAFFERIHGGVLIE